MGNKTRSKIPYKSNVRNVSKLDTTSVTPQKIWDTIVEVYTDSGATEYLPSLKQSFVDAGHNLDWKGW